LYPLPDSHPDRIFTLTGFHRIFTLTGFRPGRIFTTCPDSHHLTGFPPPDRIFTTCPKFPAPARILTT
jgi:hypothetical protein